MRSLALLLALACPAWAEVKITGEAKVPANDLVQLKAEGAPPGTVYFWSISPRLRPSQVKRGKGTIDFAAAPGTYTVSVRAVWLKDKATGELDGEEVEREVIIGDAPPAPPKPVDPPPGPPIDAALLKALADAFASDKDADKATLKGKLAALYRQGAAIAEARTPASWGDWRAAMAAAAKAMGVSGTLPATQAACNAWIKGRVPNVAAKPLGDEVPSAAVALRAVAAALEAVR